MSTRQILTTISAAVMLTACSEGGDAVIKGAPEQTEGVYAIDGPQLGHEYWCAFPLMTNTSGSAVQIEGFKIDKVSRWIRVLGYTTINVDAGSLHGDVPTTWDTAEPYEPVPPGTYLKQNQYRTKLPYKIDGHQTSSTVGVVKVALANSPAALEATRKTDVAVSGCQVTYRHGGEAATQTLKCRLILGDKYAR